MANPYCVDDRRQLDDAANGRIDSWLWPGERVEAIIPIYSPSLRARSGEAIIGTNWRVLVMKKTGWRGRVFAFWDSPSIVGVELHQRAMHGYLAVVGGFLQSPAYVQPWRKKIKLPHVLPVAGSSRFSRAIGTSAEWLPQRVEVLQKAIESAQLASRPQSAAPAPTVEHESGSNSQEPNPTAPRSDPR